MRIKTGAFMFHMDTPALINIGMVGKVSELTSRSYNMSCASPSVQGGYVSVDIIKIES